MYIHNSVGAVHRLSSMLWTQIALEKELWTCIPTVLQVNIKTILRNAVSIRWNDNNSVWHIPTRYISVYTRIYTYIHQHSINNSIPLD